MKKRFLSMILALVMIISLLPLAANAALFEASTACQHSKARPVQMYLAPTCGQAGKMSIKYCDACQAAGRKPYVMDGKVYSFAEYQAGLPSSIPATGIHSFEDGTCTVCGACEHTDWAPFQKAVPATCEKDGTKAIVFCIDCYDPENGVNVCRVEGKLYDSFEDAKNAARIPSAGGHSYNKDGVCTACGHCKHTDLRPYKSAKDVTCLEDGNKTIYFCGGCYYKNSDSESESSVTGVMLYVVDGESYENYEDAEKAAKIAAPGKHTYEDGVCTACGDCNHSDLRPYAQAKEVGCLEDGSKAIYFCGGCYYSESATMLYVVDGELYETYADAVKAAKIAAPGKHNYEDGVCTVCGDCNHSDLRPYAQAKEVGCLEDGSKAIYFCGGCYYSESETMLYAVDGELYETYADAVEAAKIAAPGKHTYEDGVCTACGAKSPFSTAPDESDEEEDAEPKCTHSQHNLMITVGGKCEACGSSTPIFTTAPDQSDDAHKCFADGNIKAVDNEDGKTHAIVCAKCDAPWEGKEEEAHNWENAVCTECGAKSPFSTAPDESDEEETEQPEVPEKKCPNKLHNVVKQLGWPCVGCGDEDFACRYPLHKLLKKLGIFCMGCDLWEAEDDNTEETIPEQTESEETEDNTTAETEHECSEFKAVANKDGMSHAIVCADDDCKAFQKNEAHKWEDGVCADCGAESPFQATPKCEHPSGVSIDQEVHEATCEEDGYILTVKVCDACGEEFEVRSELGEATGHDWEDGVCTNCGEESPFQTAPKNCKHPSGVSIAQKIVEPTCEEDGHILTKQICNDCGEEFERKDPLGKKAIGHDWKQTVTEATCTTDRKEEYECNNCGDTYEHVYTGSATGHTYVNGKCACGDVEAAEEIAPHKHSGAAVGQKVYEATCEKDGYILTKKVCDTCGETFEVKSPLGNAIGHNWKQTITPATCDEDGNEHYECTNCGDYYDVAIKANGHTYVNGKCACGAAQNSGSSNDKINFWNKYDVHFVGGSAY